MATPVDPHRATQSVSLPADPAAVVLAEIFAAILSWPVPEAAGREEARPRIDVHEGESMTREAVLE